MKVSFWTLSGHQIQKPAIWQGPLSNHFPVLWPPQRPTQRTFPVPCFSPPGRCICLWRPIWHRGKGGKSGWKRCQEQITVTNIGSDFHPVFPTQKPDGGFYDSKLRCRYRTSVADDHIAFTLFDTPESLNAKLELAHGLGVTRAVGLYQELGTFLSGKSSS